MPGDARELVHRDRAVDVAAPDEEPHVVEFPQLHQALPADGAFPEAALLPEVLHPPARRTGRAVDDSGAAVRSRQEKRIGNLVVSGDENVFSAEQRLTVGGGSGAGEAPSPGAQAKEAIALLSAAVASSSELRPGKKASLKEILDALAGAVRGDRLEREYANGQFAQDLGELRVLLAPVLHLEIGTALKELEAALAQLRA